MARLQPILTTVALAALLGAAPAHAVIHLSFGLYTSNKPTTMVRQFRPVLDLVEERTSENLGTAVEIRIQVAKDYEQGIAHLASGKVDFSRFGPASYIEAKRANSGLRILAMERVRGDKVFYGIIAVGKDSPITSVEQLNGRSFAFGNDQSTIGRYLSQLYLRNHGILSADLSRFEYLGRHDTVGTAVGAGHFDAGALNEATFSKLVAKGVPIRELARFPNVTKPWIAREGLPERLFEALRDALLVIEDPVVAKLLKADGFVSGDDADFSDIRAAIEMNGKFFEPPSSSDEAATASRDEGGSVDAASDVTPAMAGGAAPEGDAGRAALPGAADTPTVDASAAADDVASAQGTVSQPVSADHSATATAVGDATPPEGTVPQPVSAEDSATAAAAADDATPLEGTMSQPVSAEDSATAAAAAGDATPLEGTMSQPVSVEDSASAAAAAGDATPLEGTVSQPVSAEDAASAGAPAGDATPRKGTVPPSVSTDDAASPERGAAVYIDHPGRAPALPGAAGAHAAVPQSAERSAGVTASLSQSGAAKSAP